MHLQYEFCHLTVFFLAHTTHIRYLEVLDLKLDYIQTMLCPVEKEMLPMFALQERHCLMLWFAK